MYILIKKLKENEKKYLIISYCEAQIKSKCLSSRETNKGNLKIIAKSSPFLQVEGTTNQEKRLLTANFTEINNFVQGIFEFFKHEQLPAPTLGLLWGRFEPGFSLQDFWEKNMLFCGNVTKKTHSI